MWQELQWGNWQPWTMKMKEHRQNLEVGNLERFRLAQPSFEENHLVLWEEAKI